MNIMKMKMALPLVAAMCAFGGTATVNSASAVTITIDKVQQRFP